MKGKMKKIATLLVVLCMTFSMFVLNAFAEDSSSTSELADSTNKIDKCETVIKEYSETEAADYLAGDNTYPTLDGYLFAGWYTDKECSKDTALAGGEPTGTTYALFVPEHVLSIKAQVSANLLDDDDTNDGTASLRFITTVDTLLYKQVGFEVSYTDANGNVRKATSASNKVYSKLYVCGNNSEVWSKTPEATFCGLSQYFKACTVKNIPSTYFETTFTVKPYWITLDGNKIYGISAEKTVAEGVLRSEVWVSADGTNALHRGSEENPYETLDYALAHVEDGGKVHLINTVSIKGEKVGDEATDWPAHNKENVTITGGTLDVTTDDLFINDGVIFSNMTLQIAESTSETRTFNRIFAEGNDVTISSDVTVSNLEDSVQLFGGSTAEIESTNLKVYAGTYAHICGGNSSGNVTGNVNLTVGGKASTSSVYGGCYQGNVLGDVNITATAGMNDDADYTKDETTYQLFGGAYLGNVEGNINIAVEEGAKFSFIYGGICGNSDNEEGTVKGKISIDFAGEAYSIYGGSYHGSNADTCVTVTGGNVYQVFGGGRFVTFEGNTDVRILGGTVYRRIYGGSYNNYDGSWDDPSRQVIGYTSVTISSDATIDLSKDIDRALIALSRYKKAQTGEWGVLIFEDGLYDTYSSKIGSSSNSLLGISQYYHYLVKATTGGEVRSAGEYLNIKPDTGYVATVYRVVDGVEVEKHYTESNSYYQLPGLDASTDKTEIIVKFSPSTEAKTDFTGYKAKIGTAYYQTVEEAISAAEKWEDATIEDLTGEHQYVKITVEESKYGTLSVDKKYCEVGDEVVIQEVEILDSSYYLAGVLINNKEVELSDGTYTLTTEESSYVIEGIYRKKIFTDNSNWDLTQQNQGTDEEGVTSGVITYTRPSEGSASWLYLYQATSGAQEYGDVDLTLNIRNFDGKFSNSNTQVRFDFTNGKWFRFVVEETSAGGVKVYRTGDAANSLDFEFTSDEVKAYGSDEGIDIRIVREGTVFNFYVGGVFRKSLDLSSVLEISSDTKAAVGILRDNDKNITTSLSYKLLLPIVRIEDSEYGTVVADKYTFSHGEEIVIQEGESYDSSYYLAGLLINDEEVELDSDGTYTLTATKVSYVIEGIYRKKIFTDNSNWDLSQQNQGTDAEGVTSGVITYEKPSDTTSASWLYLYGTTSEGKEYGDVDLTLNIRNYDGKFSDSSKQSNTQVKFETAASSNYWFRFVVEETSAGGVIVYRTGINDLNTKSDPDYTFTEEDLEAYGSDEGINIRVVREGTMFYLYVGENCRVTLDLSASISSDTKSAVCILRDNDAGLATSISYKLYLPVTTIELEESDI